MVRFGTSIVATKFYIPGNCCECTLVVNEGSDRERSQRFGNLPFEITDLQIHLPKLKIAVCYIICASAADLVKMTTRHHNTS
jgi:hypothetical protein